MPDGFGSFDPFTGGFGGPYSLNPRSAGSVEPGRNLRFHMARSGPVGSGSLQGPTFGKGIQAMGQIGIAGFKAVQAYRNRGEAFSNAHATPTHVNLPTQETPGGEPEPVENQMAVGPAPALMQQSLSSAQKQAMSIRLRGAFSSPYSPNPY